MSSQTASYMGVVVGSVTSTFSALISLTSPTWIVYQLSHPRVYDHIGLFTRCSRSACVPFPSTRFCSSLTTPVSHIPLHPRGKPPTPPFCTKWRSAGFLVNISVGLNLVSLVVAALLLLGNAHEPHSYHMPRKHGTRIMAVLMMIAGAVELGAVAMVSELKEYEEMFQVPGYEHGQAWWVGLGGGVLSLIMGLGVGLVRLMDLPERTGEGIDGEV
ncbi:uncharacterized protein QC763_203185 [Podospora pseudopauciseta]|uniref:Uncharacterized protein n=2 Tax=Podospora TaxID=5144 RepID=A0ABR0HMY6_9PEZI|nr:hypothetical protein QC763_203185 [Podospora pseudopauciseta]KAK4679324.1 hypothetical protein QC764_203185 [Podospora pseudoanserina]